MSERVNNKVNESSLTPRMRMRSPSWIRIRIRIRFVFNRVGGSADPRMKLNYSITKEPGRWRWLCGCGWKMRRRGTRRAGDSFRGDNACHLHLLPFAYLRSTQRNNIELMELIPLRKKSVLGNNIAKFKVIQKYYEEHLWLIVWFSIKFKNYCLKKTKSYKILCLR